MQDWDKVKTVGKRMPNPANALYEEWDEFLELIYSLKLEKVFVPRGVYRYKTFEEANEWMEKMVMGTKPTVAPLKPKI